MRLTQHREDAKWLREWMPGGFKAKHYDIGTRYLRLILMAEAWLAPVQHVNVVKMERRLRLVIRDTEVKK